MERVGELEITKQVCLTSITSQNHWITEEEDLISLIPIITLSIYLSVS